MDMEETFEAECISEKKDLTEGKIYQVKQSKYTNMYELVDDTGHVDTYLKERFKIIEKPAMEVGEIKFYENGHIECSISKEEYKKGVEGDKMEDKTIKVRCIDKQNYPWLTLNEEYEAENIGEVVTTIKDDTRKFRHYPSELFEKVKEVLMVECVENKKYIYDNITIGKEYQVLDETGSAYKITNNYGEKTYYQKDCFKTVEPQKEKEYSVMELLDFPVGTIFKYGDGKVKIIEHEKGNKGTEIIGISRGIELSTNWTKTKFTLIEEPKPVSTAEAFKALDEGKEIESVISKDKYKKINGTIYIEKEDGDTGKLMYMYRNELEGQWIIIE